MRRRKSFPLWIFLLFGIFLRLTVNIEITFSLKFIWKQEKNAEYDIYLGVKLPDYITRLLQLTGYNNLQSLSKLDDSRLIEELEHYTTDNLDASDLAIPESKQKFYFNKETKKFCILPGHKHLIIDAAETVQRILQRAEDEFHTQQQQQSLEEYE